MVQKIVFFGSGWYTVPVMRRLLPHGLDLVVTTEKNPDSPFLKFCTEKKIKTLTVSSASDLTNHQSQITDHQLAILASFGAIIPQSIIDSFPNGIINIHPSLLPKYKGPSPIQYALLNGETTTGVTLITLDDQVDHGPILSQQPYELQGNETSEDLLSILFEIGAGMVEEQIVKLENGEQLTSAPQDHNKESWSKKISKQDGFIDLSKITASELEIGNLKLEIARKLRAYYPWPGVWLRYTSPVIPESSPLSNKLIKLLPENLIQVEGKKPMSYKDFENGYGNEGTLLLKRLGLSS